MKNSLPSIDVLGVRINVTNMQNAVATIEPWLANGRRKYVCVTGVHGVMECQQDSSLIPIHNGSGLTVPDGMPMVWAGKLNGHKKMGRVYGPDLMLELCGLSVERGYTHFLYGGNTGIAQILKRNLEERFPGIRIVGACTPPFRPLNEVEEAHLIDQVDKFKPDFFWVGLSTPKQERFMAEYIRKLDVGVMLGVGAAFDVHAGVTNDAPDFFKKVGMQWFYRLCQEPRRLWKRYLYNNPVFVYKFSKQLLQNGRHGPR